MELNINKADFYCNFTDSFVFMTAKVFLKYIDSNSKYFPPLPGFTKGTTSKSNFSFVVSIASVSFSSSARSM